jgi:hypothetical protein
VGSSVPPDTDVDVAGLDADWEPAEALAAAQDEPGSAISSAQALAESLSLGISIHPLRNFFVIEANDISFLGARFHRRKLYIVLMAARSRLYWIISLFTSGTKAEADTILIPLIQPAF